MTSHCPMERGKYPFSFNAQHERRNTMPLIQLVIVLVVVGVILWLVNSYIPMQATIKKILNVVVIIAVILWLLSVFGLIGNLSTIRIGK
jgi:Flp pilus assembly protein TadB